MGLEAKVGEDGQQVMAGQEARFVDIEADAGAGLGVFEELHGLDGGERFSDALKAAGNAHYGHAGRAFLRKLLDDVEGAKAQARQRMEAFAANAGVDGATSQVTRVAKRFALAAAAGEMAIAWGVLPWPEGTGARSPSSGCFGNGASAGAQTGRSKASKSWPMCARSSSATAPRGSCPWEAPSTPVINRLGFMRKDRDGEEVTYYVFSEMFVQEFCKGFDPKRVKQELHSDRGSDAGRKAQDDHGSERLPGDGKKRVYVINGNALFADE